VLAGWQEAAQQPILIKRIASLSDKSFQVLANCVNIPHRPLRTTSTCPIADMRSMPRTKLRLSLIHRKPRIGIESCAHHHAACIVGICKSSCVAHPLRRIQDTCSSERVSPPVRRRLDTHSGFCVCRRTCTFVPAWMGRALTGMLPEIARQIHSSSRYHPSYPARKAECSLAKSQGVG
jgi:hypothetical protein